MDFESRWIRRVQQSAHEESANLLVKKYYKEIFSFVYKQVLDEQLALDLTQEIFIRMLQAITNFNKKKAAFRTWLYRIASNHCIDYFRSKSYQAGQLTNYVEDLELIDAVDIVNYLIKKEDLEEVNLLLYKYEVQTQQILRYKLFLELTFQEIAGLLNLSESTVKTRYYAVLKKLREEMEANLNGKQKMGNSVSNR
ncbi:RNA polymerase sigma factor [Lysinibacillus sp. NPDC096212]|uniref:RNA polymerase sigma factor n=1 Tax=unclassified Lysinibacillus TaxID=2636778 RepID=UPI00380E7096